jgi:hypothetical protein
MCKNNINISLGMWLIGLFLNFFCHAKEGIETVPEFRIFMRAAACKLRACGTDSRRNIGLQSMQVGPGTFAKFCLQAK